MDPVTLEREDRVAILRLNQPATRNALGPEIKAGMAKFVPELTGDAGVGCIVITGSGGAFCSGGDIKAMNSRDPAAVLERMRHSYSWAYPLMVSEKPVVAAVNGVAAGAGFSLALMGDIILAGESATFRAGFPAIGAAPDLGIAFTLTRAIGAARAKDILMTNRVLTARDAEAMGLVSRVMADEVLMAEALKLAHQLAEGPVSLSLTKELVNRAFTSSLAEFLEHEALTQAAAFGTADFAEGVAAFLEKRKPVFPHG